MSQPASKKNRPRKKKPSAPAIVLQAAPQPAQSAVVPKSRRQKKRSNRKIFNGAVVAHNTGNVAGMIESLRSFASSGVNEQDFTLGVDFRSLPRHVQYVFCLLYPKQFQARIPDGSNKRSALYTSVQVYDIPVAFTGAANDGTFAGAAQPILGNPSAPNTYKLAVCDPTQLSVDDPSTNWSSTSAFMSKIDNVNPRIDQNLNLLTAPSIGYWGAGLGTGASASKPFGTSLVENTGNGFTHVTYDGTGVNGIFSLPPGDSIVTVQFLAASGLAGLAAAGTATINILTTLTTNGTGTNQQQSFLVNSTASANTIYFTTAATPTAAAITVVPIARANQTGSYDSGLVQKMRPVAMSILGTSQIPNLVNGGMCSIAVVPGDTLDDSFFSNSANGPGPLRSYQTIAQVPGSYNGRLEKGFFGIWSTESPDDREFMKPSQVNNYEYPTFVFAGTYVPSNPITPTQIIPVIRLELVQVFEYTTINQFPSTQLSLGSQHEVDMALGLIANLPRCMANGEHTGFLQKVMSVIGGFGQKAKTIYGKAKQYLPAIERGIEMMASIA